MVPVKIVSYYVHASALTIAALFGGLGAGSCSTGAAAKSGSCVLTSPELDCSVGVDGGPAVPAAGLLGYACTGSARPDDSPSFIDGVPKGIVCSDRGNPDGTEHYCCTAEATTCAYNPVADCSSTTFGYECRGSDRPDALNPTLVCGQGLRVDELVHYCCSGQREKPGCQAYSAAGCPNALDGWLCTGASLPTEEQLGPSESRADYTYEICSMPIAAPNPDVHYFCCFTPKGLPEGASCVQDVAVPGCAPGNFGFACYGPDTPEQDYPIVRCRNEDGTPETPVSGRSMEGYPALLYCCTFE